MIRSVDSSSSPVAVSACDGARSRFGGRMLLAAILALCVAGGLISWQLLGMSAIDQASPTGSGGPLIKICSAVGLSGSDCGGALRSDWVGLRIPLPDASLKIRIRTIPVAFLGVAYFALLGIWFGTIRHPRRVGFRLGSVALRLDRLPIHVGTCGLVSSVFFVALMATGAAPMCLWCLLVHLINAALIVCIWLVYHRFGWAPTIRDRRWADDGLGAVTPTHLLTSLTLIAVVIVGVGLDYRHDKAHRNQIRALEPFKSTVLSLQRDPVFLLREYAAQPVHEIPIREQSTGGRDHARLVVFTDYECPMCFCAVKSLREDVCAALDGRIDILVRHYPLCGSCNESVESEFHPNACDAAYAAEAARFLGGDSIFEQMNDLLFEHRANLKPELYCTLAVQLGLDAASFRREMRSDRVRQVICDDIALAKALGIAGTPAYFLNGRRVPDICRTHVFWTAVGSGMLGRGEVELAGAMGELTDRVHAMEETAR